ncbi:uncharacterized protein LOC143553973 [Bidens hawaiensis]|uniref:uncharacterized protein LOC143553973 n=1 Tax=Bidens hawaiensis TaxID=980011 RepID=UPI00404ABF10
MFIICRGYHVIAIDIDPKKVEMASNNSKIYGVDSYIDFIVGDFLQLAPSLKGNVAFLSPPWGGPSYKTTENFTLDLLKPVDGYTLFQVAQTITPNIMMFLPRNVDVCQVEQLSWLSSPPLNVEIEENYVRGFLKGVTAYFGKTAYWGVAQETSSVHICEPTTSTPDGDVPKRVADYDETDRRMLNEDNRAFDVLTVCLSREIALTLRDYTTTKGLWDALVNKFEGNLEMKKSKKGMLKGEFNMLNYVQGESIASLIQRFETLITKIESAGIG